MLLVVVCICTEKFPSRRWGCDVLELHYVADVVIDGNVIRVQVVPLLHLATRVYLDIGP